MSNGEKPRTFMGHEVEPAEPDPGPGWLRSRFMGLPWPREGVAACGRRECPVCGPANRVSEKPECAPMEPERSECREQAPAVQVLHPQITGDDTIQTEEAIQHLRRYFHIYEGLSYYTLRCEICQQMFGIEPNKPILERDSFDMLMNHAKAHNKTPTRPLDYSRQPTTEAIANARDLKDFARGAP
jgi:hypothetical protein